MVKTRYGMQRKARAKMYYLGVGRYFQDMFRQPDIAVKLDYNQGGKHPGSIKNSRGFHRKVFSNPVMAGDGRNQAVIATADGVPLFKDMTARKGTPSCYAQQMEVRVCRRIYTKRTCSVTSLARPGMLLKTAVRSGL
jgi:hypothetical protein